MYKSPSTPLNSNSARFARRFARRSPLVAEFNPQGISNTALAFAKAGHQDADLFKNLAKIVILQLNEFNAQDYANTSWAFAKVRNCEERSDDLGIRQMRSK